MDSPTAEKQATGLFFIGLSNPIIHKKRTPIRVFFFYGVDNGIRTHDLQSHNLTR